MEMGRSSGQKQRRALDQKGGTMAATIYLSHPRKTPHPLDRRFSDNSGYKLGTEGPRPANVERDGRGLCPAVDVIRLGVSKYYHLM